MAGLPPSASACSWCWSRSQSTSSASHSSNATKEMKTMSRIRNHPMAALGVLVLGLFMTLLDLTIVNIAIPSILDGLHASLDQVLWVLNAYSLLYAVLLITSARLGDIYGPRNLFAVGVVIFTVASAFSGLAQDRPPRGGVGHRRTPGRDLRPDRRPALRLGRRHRLHHDPRDHWRGHRAPGGLPLLPGTPAKCGTAASVRSLQGPQLHAHDAGHGRDGVCDPRHLPPADHLHAIGARIERHRRRHHPGHPAGGDVLCLRSCQQPGPEGDRQIPSDPGSPGTGGRDRLY